MRRVLLAVLLVAGVATSSAAQTSVPPPTRSALAWNHAFVEALVLAARQGGGGIIPGARGITAGGTATGAITVSLSNLVTTSTDGFVALNATAATAGVPVQISPRSRWRGTAWDTAASETVDFFVENLPATAATPTGTLKFGYSLNVAAATYPMTLTSTGLVTLSGASTASAVVDGSTNGTAGLTAKQDISGADSSVGFAKWASNAFVLGTTVTGAGAQRSIGLSPGTGHIVADSTADFQWNGRGRIASSADGKFQFANNGNTTNACWDVTTDAVAKLYDGDCASAASLVVAGTTITNAGAITAAGTISTPAGTTAIAPLVVTNGTNLTTATANSVENDGTAFYTTGDTTNGRRYSDGWNYFRLTGSGSGITGIADFFGTNDGIPLVASGVYEIEWHCEFSQVTAGTATWTIVTATTALANLDAQYMGSNIAGIGTVGAPQYAAVKATASSSTALPVTGTEATGATHIFDVHAVVIAGAGASNTRLRLTMGAGTATPLINSYFRVRRLPGGNVGSFVS